MVNKLKMFFSILIREFLHVLTIFQIFYLHFPSLFVFYLLKRKKTHHENVYFEKICKKSVKRGVFQIQDRLARVISPRKSIKMAASMDNNGGKDVCDFYKSMTAVCCKGEFLPITACKKDVVQHLNRCQASPRYHHVQVPEGLLLLYRSGLFYSTRVPWIQNM